MRRLLVEVTCDKCDKVAPEVEAVNIELVLSNAPNQTLEIDLCSNCVDPFVLGARLKPKEKKQKQKKHKKIETEPPATPASPQADGADPNMCTVCGRTFKTPRGRRAHQTRAEH